MVATKEHGVLCNKLFELLKMRFLCLHKFGGCLVYSLERYLRIITACIIFKIDEEEHEIPDEYEHDEQTGLDVRNGLIRLRFSD